MLRQRATIAKAAARPPHSKNVGRASEMLALLRQSDYVAEILPSSGAACRAPTPGGALQLAQGFGKLSDGVEEQVGFGGAEAGFGGEGAEDGDGTDSGAAGHL
jgi:hypothetical protein